MLYYHEIAKEISCIINWEVFVDRILFSYSKSDTQKLIDGDIYTVQRFYMQSYCTEMQDVHNSSLDV